MKVSQKGLIGRFAYGLFFFSASVWIWALFRVNRFPAPFTIVLAVPFYIGFLGMLQGILGFSGRKWQTSAKMQRTLYTLALCGAALMTTLFFLW